MLHAVVFIDIDTQHDFIDVDGGLPVPGAQEILPVLEKLTRLGRDAGAPILASRDTHRTDDPEFDRFPPHCVEGTPGWEKVEETTTFDQELFEKHTFDVFSNPRFAERIKEIGPRIAVVYGLATDYCVKAAVEGLLELVPRVLVVEDAIRAVDEGDGHAALEELKSRGASMITSERVKALFEEDAC
jgi:nicotinamidase/pyrazinamidase